LCAFHAVISLRYCHNPRIRLETPKDELLVPSVFMVRVRAHESNLEMVCAWFRLTRTPPHSTRLSRWRGLVLMMEEVCLAMKRSRNFTCSIIVLCVNLPPTIMSRHRSAVSRPVQKRCKIMPLCNDRSELAYSNIENLA
jgi:hypothetical protein